jgi:hypothetical protein
VQSGQGWVGYDDAKETPNKVAAAIDRLDYKVAELPVADAPREAPARR